MATKPEIKTMTADSGKILSAFVRENRSQFGESIPTTVTTDEQVRSIGNTIMMYEPLRNAFVNLLNRIAMLIVTSKMFTNPIAMFKRGILEFGETVEETFVEMVKPHEYDPEVAESEVFKRELPNLLTAFHTLNYAKFYKQTIQNDELRKAFLSWNGITDLIAKITEKMYTSASYDEFLTMKYILAQAILNGEVHVEQVGATTAANMKSITSRIKGVSNSMEFLSNKYNQAGVFTSTLKNDQFLILSANFDASMDVEVMASAFNMDKVEFLGHRVLIDSFGALDTERLNELFAEDPGYKTISDVDLSLLNSIGAVIVDRDWFMVFDNMNQFTENYNGQGLYWNYFYHTWKIFSHSPFSNAVVFYSGEPTVTAVSITPAKVTVSAGMQFTLKADVTTTNFASKEVVWSSNNDSVSVNANGIVVVSPTATAGTATITATSVADNTKSATSTITITA